MEEAKDPMGAAIADFYKNGKAGRLHVFSPDFEEDEIPVSTLFREYDEMPALEQKALQMANGRILDVGAGAGCHSLALQEMSKDVTAIDISPLSAKTMQARGVRNAILQDFWDIRDSFDTILMLMNGIGIVGTLDQLPRFFKHIDNLLTEGGQLLLDSTDIHYIFEDEENKEEEEGNEEEEENNDEQGTEVEKDKEKDMDHHEDCGVNNLGVGFSPPYYGELLYQMQYKRIKGSEFPWLYIDFTTLSHIARDCGFKAELVANGTHYDYLAKITRK